MNLSNPPPFGLRLASVRVQDFKSLHDICVHLAPGTTVLVGENNSGKTSFLEALAVCFGRRRASAEDFHNDPLGRASAFEIDLRIETADGSDFPNSVRDVVGDGIQVEDPEFINIRFRGELAPDGWEVNYQRSFVKGWAQGRAEAARLEVMGAPSVGKKSLDLLQYDMLDARRDIVEQLRNRNTYWGRTTASVSFDPEIKRTLEASLKQLGEQVTANSDVLTKVREDLTEMSSALSAGALGVELEALPRSVGDLIRAMDIVITSPSSSAFSVSNHGMGTRSLAALLVFKSFVNTVRSQQKAERTLNLAAFEEPEAHLHPQSQRAVFQLLGGIGGQRLVSTHSPQVAAIAQVDSFRVFRREGSRTVVSQVDPVKASSWDTTRVKRFVQTQNPEVLFAKAVGIVEGVTEATAFPVLANAWWSGGNDAVGVSLIYTEGAGNSKHIIPFLVNLGIPWIIFADGDKAGREGLAATGMLIGRALDRTSPEVVQLPDGQSFEEYLVLGGSRSSVLAAINAHVDGPLADYKQRMNGQMRSKNEVRNYSGPDGDDLAMIDFLKAHKGTLGRQLATELLGGGLQGLPAHMHDFFTRLDRRRASNG